MNSLGTKTIVSTDASAPAPALGTGQQWIRNSATEPVVYGGSDRAKPRGLTAFMQTPGQERALMPGGYLVGRLDAVVIEPFFALPQYSSGYTLADMKAANPNTKFYAYTNGAICHAVDSNSGVFQTTLDPNDVAWLKQLVPVPTPASWTGDHAAKSQTYQGTAYVGYSDFQGYYLTRIDLDDYRSRFAAFAKTILSTASKSTKGAPDAYFDGIALDDTNMSPQHGIELPAADAATSTASALAPELYGPWTTNKQYGEDMVDFAADVARRLKTEFTQGAEPLVMCNIGATPSNAQQRGLALDLAARTAGGGPAMDRMLREFTTVWNDGKAALDTYTTQHVLQFAADLAVRGVVMDLADRGAPPAAPTTGPTAAEKSVWDKQQRLVMGLALLAQAPGAPVQPAPQAVQVHEGRNQWADTTKAEDMGAKVADLDAATLYPVTKWPRASVIPTGRLNRSGDVLWRTVYGGTVYANVSTTDATVNGVTVPARDAVIV